ncbi:MAG: M3 family oligoendopeptidase [Clostridia bacterium]|nr:M3 family oligoendopeptidase [Clostridia bacterium]
MKFTEMQYLRPDTDAMIALCKTAEEGIKNAPDAQAVLTIYRNLMQEQAHFYSMASLAYIRFTLNTKDEFYNTEKTFLDEQGPLLQGPAQAVDLALLESPFRAELEKELGTLLFKNLEISVRSFRPELVPLMQEANKLESAYQELYASGTVEWEGETIPLPMLGLYKESPDRATRKKAFEKEGGFFDAHREELDTIFDKLVKNRNAQARLLGHENYLQLGYDRLGRNCYGYNELKAFRKQIAEDLVPVVTMTKEDQKKRIGVDEIHLYDHDFLFADGNALPKGTPDDILAAGKKMYDEMNPETAEFIDFMYENQLLDVLSKEGKAPGGYCSTIEDYKAPFIFSNFNGTADDVDVLTHEAGHAFAAFRAFKNNLPLYAQSPTMEACEVHSMSMEFLTQDFHHLFFGENTAKYEYVHAANALSFIPYGCMVDEFQHIMYENENLTPDERNQVWLDLEKKYRPHLHQEDLPFYGRGSGWQFKLHIYLHPLYYIDYCMAQAVAFRFWTMSLKDPADAWKRYLAFVDLGGTVTFEEAVRAAGIPLPYDEGSMGEVAREIAAWLEAHKL